MPDLANYSGLERAPVAQLDRAPGFEPVGRRFESCRARHSHCTNIGRVAQLVEQLTLNQLVGGSIPPTPTREIKYLGLFFGGAFFFDSRFAHNLPIKNEGKGGSIPCLSVRKIFPLAPEEPEWITPDPTPLAYKWTTTPTEED